MQLSDSIRSLKGVGPKTEELFGRLGIFTRDDLLFHFPFRYVEYPFPKDHIPQEGDETDKICIQAVLKAPLVNRFQNRRSLTEGRITTKKEMIFVRWFNSPYLKNTILPGKRYVFWGMLSYKAGEPFLEHPVVYEASAYSLLAGTMHPVYTTTKGLGQNKISSAVREVLTWHQETLGDYLDIVQRKRLGLIERGKAIQYLHFPPSKKEAIAAKKRLAFDEFFLFLYNIRETRNSVQAIRTKRLQQNQRDYNELEQILPYHLTGDQKVTITHIWNELCLSKSMHRLLQGDVGSGKTIVAAFAMYLVFKNNCQSVMMVPTEVLANQHYDSLSKLFALLSSPPRLGLLTGSLTKAQQRAVYKKAEEGEVDILIGTHALLEEGIRFRDLSLVITDEQHRFGVRQRQRLADKGDTPHVLVMSATPIPRTLALILYGDLDMSFLKEKPGGRLPVKNAVISPKERKKAYRHIMGELNKGHQAYVICSMVEESENIEAENVTDYAEKLSSYFPSSTRIEILHGRMKEERKAQVMEAFKQKEIDILVSTTVIEVGVDVPNATVILIEDAQRFGLAALHQLRGRVGRSNLQSYCILVRTTDKENAQKRLEILSSSNDGFYLAEEDLKLRGGGELLGVAQSGDLHFSVAGLYEDGDMLSLAREFLQEVSADTEETVSADFLRYMEEYRKKTVRQIHL